jgi:lysyl-tRNA synthetase class 2
VIETTGGWPRALKYGAARKQLELRATVLAKIRGYFATQKVLEVETPALAEFPVTDPQLDNLSIAKPFSASPTTDRLFLQTSPEYAMKQLLAKGSGSIYQICKAYRCDHPGKLHAIEFTMLEWYRIDFTLAQLIADVAAMLAIFFRDKPVEIISYQTAFIRHARIDPFRATGAQLKAHAKKFIDTDIEECDIDLWRDLLLTHCVEKELGKNKLTFITDYPASQAALATTVRDSNGFEVAQRFELYIDGIEIANGYQELRDVAEHQRRFEIHNQQRIDRGKTEMPIDVDFLAALQQGLPACAGVALGIDRLLLCLQN